MPLYTYKALTERGERITGEIQADSHDAVSRELESKGFLPQSISANTHIFTRSARQRIKPEHFLLFNQELIALLKAGISVTESLIEVADRPGHPGFSTALKDILLQVRAGVSLSKACEQFPEYFDPLYISALETGESIGDFTVTLSRYHKQLVNRIRLQRQLSQALAYPVFLLILLLFVMVVLFTFVLPKFVTLYADFGSDLPVPTQWLMVAVEYSPIWGAGLIFLIFASVYGHRIYVKTESRQRSLDSLILALPFIGSLTRLRLTAQMTRTMATLLTSGLPMVEAIRKTTMVLFNRAFAKKLEEAATLVNGGESLVASLKQLGLVSGSSYKILNAGERSGNLAGMLDEVSDYLEQTLSHRLTRFTGLLEPLLMLLVGIVVGGIILVMYLPIFSMTEVIQ